jgi:16S rRNA (guanine966-N2)-methyltransferase
VTRVIGGTVGGRRLATVPGSATRPTTDRVREALFSALESDLGTLSGRSFLDLYAGSGAVGLEAASRGAERVVLIERAPAAVSVIRRNISTLGLGGVVLIGAPVERQARRPVPAGGSFDIAFADAPYDEAASAVAEVLEGLLRHGWLAAAARVVVERDRRTAWEWPAGFVAVRERTYGETMLWYGRVAPPGPADEHRVDDEED